MKPDKIIIFGKKYTITYCDNPSLVDSQSRESLWGQVDYWTRTIRVFDNGRTIEDIWETIMHETLHAIGAQLRLNILGKDDPDDDVHEELSILALALVDVLFTNKFEFVGGEE